MFEQMLKSYFKKVFEVGKSGDAREESYYSTLVDLLNTYADSINKKNIHITTLPKKTEAGNPDFRIWDGKQHIVGYIEAKSPTVKKDYKLFSKMGEYGKKLVDLHLLKSKEIDPPIAKFKGKGEDKVGKVTYKEDKVLINEDQYFEGITEEVWQYQIGGYQVCDKWLKDRKGRMLSLEDIKHYCKVVTAIENTIEIQKEIDNLYPEIEKESIEFKNLKNKQ